MDIKITKATKDMAPEIASLIMVAMNYDCCLYFAGKNHTLEEFRQMMTALVEREDSQYSYLNTIVAIDSEAGKGNNVAGICTSYDGSRLHQLRRAFVEAEREWFSQDFSNMADETQPGELYVDSLCVRQEYRNNGIATKLLMATVEKARSMGIGLTGLLVDKGNPEAEKLYMKVGFHHVDDNEWGGHPMKHLVADSR